MRRLHQWVEDFILHISRFNNFSKVLPVCANGVIKNQNISFSAAIGNIYAPVKEDSIEHISCLKNVEESTSGMRNWRLSYLKLSLNSPLLLETFMRS